jgi:hypothetical protein
LHDAYFGMLQGDRIIRDFIAPAARAGPVGNAFAVVASTMTNVTGEIDELVQTAMSSSMAY